MSAAAASTPIREDGATPGSEFVERLETAFAEFIGVPEAVLCKPGRLTPEEFDLYRHEGLEKGFLEVVAGPMVRSSYRAEQALQKNNVGLAV